ncbi:hypothetical protein AB0M88_33455, partial [Actinoplanes sp. NPDC051411]
RGGPGGWGGRRGPPGFATAAPGLDKASPEGGAPSATASPVPRRRVLLATVAAAIVVAVPVVVALAHRMSPGAAAPAAPLASADANRQPPGLPAASGPAPSGVPSASMSMPAGQRESRPPSGPASVATRPPTAGEAAVVVKPVKPTLAAFFNNVAVTDDARPTAGNFDGGGATYSAQALAAGGARPGASLTVKGVTLTWPSAAGSGHADNAIAAGQTIGVPGSGRTLAFLAAADYGDVSAGGQITYTDGTVQAYTLSTPDWNEVGDPSTVAVAQYQNRADGLPYESPAGVFGVTVPLAAGKSVASVRLPFAGPVPAREGATTLHLFAARIG